LFLASKLCPDNRHQRRQSAELQIKEKPRIARWRGCFRLAAQGAMQSKTAVRSLHPSPQRPDWGAPTAINGWSEQNLHGLFYRNAQVSAAALRRSKAKPYYEQRYKDRLLYNLTKTSKRTRISAHALSRPATGFSFLRSAPRTPAGPLIPKRKKRGFDHLQ